MSDSNSASNETADTNDDSEISEETVSDSNSDSNETVDTNDDSEISEETVSDSNSDSNETADTDGFNFDPTVNEEEIAIIVGVSAVTIVAISLIVVYASKKKKSNQEIVTSMIAEVEYKKNKLENLVSQRQKMLVELHNIKNGHVSVSNNETQYIKKIKEDLEENNKAIQNGIAEELKWDSNRKKIGSLQEIIALQDYPVKKVYMNYKIKKYLHTVLYEIDVLEKLILQKEGELNNLKSVPTADLNSDENVKAENSKLLLESKIAILTEMKLERINEKTNILKLAAGQKVGELKIQRMKELKKIALREKALSILQTENKPSKFEEFKKAMHDLLGLENNIFNDKVTVQEQRKTNNITGRKFTNLINFEEIKFENLSGELERWKNPSGTTDPRISGMKFLALTSTGKSSLANFLEKYAEDFKYLYELRNKIDLALTLKELESLE